MCLTTLLGAKGLCRQLGVETKAERRTPPTTCFTFLGIQLNTVSQVTSIPQEKLASIQQELVAFRSKINAPCSPSLVNWPLLRKPFQWGPHIRRPPVRCQQKKLHPCTTIYINAGRSKLHGGFISHTPEMGNVFS